ncbi:MAG: succinate dehydrogenase cytochrome b subunit [candidate division Zixibacteria bacterium]|nr:succinate dehydrogenase cytochrome b subunit [candidate division Zixibacteria bacterium]
MDTVQVKPTPAQAELKFISSSIGKKMLHAVTGLFMFVFVAGHMVGNLQIFISQDQLNTYAQALKDLPALTWSVRIVMLVCLVIHVWRGIQLYFENRFSRPIRYVVNTTVQAPLASRTMIFTGGGVFLYLVYHLLHFTFIVTNPQYANLHDTLGRHDVYSMVILGFQNGLISAVYFVALFCLCYHLTHAIPSLFQTLGLNNEKTEPKFKVLGWLVAIAIFVGYSVIPAAVLLQIIKLPEGVH